MLTCHSGAKKKKAGVWEFKGKAGNAQVDEEEQIW